MRSNLDGLQRMARYHRWANNVLSEHVRDMDESDYRTDVGLFFDSVHGTLNHILLVDRLWYARFIGDTFAPAGLDEELASNRRDLLKQIDEQSKTWIEFVDTLDEDELKPPLRYENTQGIPRELERGPALLHVFNHATHHRGQASAGLTQLGYPAPEMDLFYYLLEQG